jgi:hypothetical protein
MEQLARIDLLADEVSSSLSWTSELRIPLIGHLSLDLNSFKTRFVITVSHVQLWEILNYK